jgi:hypothetical protein
VAKARERERLIYGAWSADRSEQASFLCRSRSTPDQDRCDEGRGDQTEPAHNQNSVSPDVTMGCLDRTYSRVSAVNQPIKVTPYRAISSGTQSIDIVEPYCAAVAPIVSGVSSPRARS